MSCLTSPDYLATSAQALLAAAGKADFDIEASVTRRRNGTLSYWLTTWDPSAERNPLDCHFSLDYGDSAEQVLDKLAVRLGGTWPIKPMTMEQKQELIRLANHQYITRVEKTEILVDLNRLNYMQAAARLTAYGLVVESRYPTQYAVVAAAYQVRPAA